jgi:FKBP-type peptidyl-prolyl cis-trans isomerase (trigger factor)
MKKRRPASIAVLLTAVIVIAVPLAACEDRGDVIATVDGVPIYAAQAEERIAGMTNLHGDVEESLGADWRTDILRTLTDEAIIQIEAERLGISISEPQIQAEILSVMNVAGGEENWDEWLEANDLTEDSLSERIRRQLLAGEVFASVMNAVMPTDEQIETYYEDNVDEYTRQGEAIPFLEVRNSIRDRLAREMQDAALADWLNSRRAEVEVEVLGDAWK